MSLHNADASKVLSETVWCTTALMYSNVPECTSVCHKTRKLIIRWILTCRKFADDARVLPLESKNGKLWFLHYS